MTMPRAILSKDLSTLGPGCSLTARWVTFTSYLARTFFSRSGLNSIPTFFVQEMYHRRGQLGELPHLHGPQGESATIFVQFSERVIAAQQLAPVGKVRIEPERQGCGLVHSPICDPIPKRKVSAGILIEQVIEGYTVVRMSRSPR